MKKVIAILVLGVAVSAAWGAASDWYGKFKTTGPDRYADGSLVLSNETYMLVWERTGTTFAGFREDGTLVNTTDSIRLNEDDWVATPRVGEGCALEAYTITIPKTYLSTGRLALYVLDSRRYSGHVYDADGSLVSVTTNVTSGLGASFGVHGYAEVAAYAELKSGLTIKGTTEGASYLLSTLDNKMIASPVITGMRFEGDYVVLKVSSTDARVTYDAIGSSQISTTERGAASLQAVAPVSGAASAGGSIEIRLRRDSEAKSQFFRVIRRQL